MLKNRLILHITVILLFSGLSFGYTQNFVVYESNAFQVKISFNDSKSAINEIWFSDASKVNWVKFTVVKTETLNSSEYIFYVNDPKGKEFSIDFNKNTEEIIVTNSQTYDNWVLILQKN